MPTPVNLAALHPVTLSPSVVQTPALTQSAEEDIMVTLVFPSLIALATSLAPTTSALPFLMAHTALFSVIPTHACPVPLAFKIFAPRKSPLVTALLAAHSVDMEPLASTTQLPTPPPVLL
jgi:hypothetical protein